jgi:hypothetical protein
MRNRKGMIVENMTELGIALITIIIAFILLTISSNLNKSGKMESSQEEMLSAVFENNVALYLKQPVELSTYPNQQMTMADLIVLAAEDKNLYGKAWRDNTDPFLPTLALSAKITRLKITINDDDKDLSVEKKFEVKEDNNDLGGPLAHKIEKKLKDWTMYLPGHVKPVKIFIESYGLRIDFYYK